MSEDVSYRQATAFMNRLFEAGLHPDEIQQVVVSRRNALARTWVERFPSRTPSSTSVAVSINQAIAIMDVNFHGVAATERCFDYEFLAKQRRRFETVPFSADTLRACASTHVLVAIAPLLLLDIHSSPCQELFWNGLRRSREQWFHNETEQFARQRAKAGWALMRKSELPGSRGKMWAEQQLLGEDEYAPSVAVITQAICVHYRATGKRLFPSLYARCREMGSCGNRILVGNFEESGFGVRGHWSDNRNDGIGLASARKLA